MENGWTEIRRAEPRASVLSGGLRWSNARYVLVHRSLLSTTQTQQIEGFLDRQPQLRRSGLENDLVIYQVVSEL